MWTSTADWGTDQAGCTGDTAEWKPSVDQQDCGALTGSRWMPSTGCPLSDPTWTDSSAAPIWSQPQSPTDECIPAASNSYTTPGPSACGCQTFQLLFWNIRYPFVPQENQPWERDGSACTDYTMQAWGRIRTRCTDPASVPAGAPILLTDADGSLIDDSMGVEAEAACAVLGGTWTAASPVYSDPSWYRPQFSAGANGTAAGADAYRTDDLWTPVNPISVNTLKYTCSNPPLYMDYWSVFGIPRAPQAAYSGLGTDKCDDAEAAPGLSRSTTPNCGPRQNTGAGTAIQDVYTNTPCAAGTETLDKYGQCSLTARIGDGVCDSNFNHPIFLYDELDCFYSAMQEISGSTIAFSG